MALTQQYDVIKDAVLDVIIGTVISFWITSLFFVVFTFGIRALRIKRKVVKKKYGDFIEGILYNYMFSDDAIEETLKVIKNHPCNKRGIFRKLLLKTLVVLHQNYSSQYKLKLEILYIKLGLHIYSIKKIKSRNWDSKIEAIKDLSNLNYQPALERIQKLIYHNNIYVQGHAVLGCFLLNGFPALLERKDSASLFLNDWIQSHIIYTIKNNVTPMPENLADFLEAKNQSFIILGIRLMDYYKARHYLPLLEKKLEETQNIILKEEYISAINHLNTY